MELLQPRTSTPAAEVNPNEVKKREGVPAYLRLLGSESAVRYPSYWLNAKNTDFHLILDSRRQRLQSKDAVYHEVEKQILKTWEADKVGHGRDAVNLGHGSIAVKKIWLIENPSLFAEYTEKRKRLCKMAAVNRPPPRINGLKGEHEVVTHRHGISLNFFVYNSTVRFSVYLLNFSSGQPYTQLKVALLMRYQFERICTREYK